MSFDGIMTCAIVNELNNNLLNGKIDKIHQPSPDEILLSVRVGKENKKVLLSSNSSRARVYLTQQKFENPDTPPMFCMLLRKHIQGGTIVSIEQIGLDRIIRLSVRAHDELGNMTIKVLIVEIMGKHSNIILVNEENTIIDSIKRIYGDISSVRQVLPGYPYLALQKQEKLDLRFFSEDDFKKMLQEMDPATQIKKSLFQVFEGVGPLFASEILFQTKLDGNTPIGLISEHQTDQIIETIVRYGKKISTKNFSPYLLLTNSVRPKVVAFYCFPLEQFETKSKKTMDSISECVENAFRERDTNDKISQTTHEIRKIISSVLHKYQKKLQKQKEEWLESTQRDTYKQYADILSSHLHVRYDNTPSIELPNFYDPDYQTIHIPMMEKLSMSQNAQRYYKIYSKMKSREKLLSEEIPKVEMEMEYLENVLLSLDHITTITEANEIKEDLKTDGYIRDHSSQKKKKTTPSSPLKFKSSDGFFIFVGKNNRQNEELTLHQAKPEDLWFHVQKMPGSHVILKTENQKVPDNSLEEAAFLAKYYSKARSSGTVPVDYTERKNVKKMKNGKTGMVNYKNFQTVFPKKDYEYEGKIEEIEE